MVLYQFIGVLGCVMDNDGKKPILGFILKYVLFFFIGILVGYWYIDLDYIKNYNDKPKSEIIEILPENIFSVVDESVAKKNTIVVFFASWCWACLLEYPVIMDLFSLEGIDKLNFIFISMDKSEKKLKDYIEKQGTRYKVHYLLSTENSDWKKDFIVDLNNRYMSKFVGSIPYIIVIPKGSKIPTYEGDKISKVQMEQILKVLE